MSPTRSLTIASAGCVVLVVAVAIDPFHYALYLSYDTTMGAWWKPAIGLVSVVLLIPAFMCLRTGRTGLAILLLSVELGLAVVLGLGVAHRDMVRIALGGWVPHQLVAILYGTTLLLRGAIIALLVSYGPKNVAAAT
jgi:hypothetical protein